MRALRRFSLLQSVFDGASDWAGGVLFVAILVWSAAPRSEAGALTSMSQYENSKALSANPMYRWSAAVRRTDAPNGTTYASAVMIAPDLFITAGHVTPRNGSLTAKLHEVVFGSNYHTSTERYAVARTERYPGYVFGDTSTIDLGVGWTTAFVSGYTSNMSFASVSTGTILTAAEYGNYGDITTGALPSIGDRLAGNARRSGASGSYPSGIYFSTWFDGPGAADPLNVCLLDFASGSPWWTASGSLAGLSIASTKTFDGGYTVVLNLSDTTVQAYLLPLIADSWARYNASIAPMPKLTCAATLTAAELTFSNLIPAREYRVMRSSTLSAWEEAHRFTATSATGSWSEALASEGQQFYRLEWTE